jgi:hypothetical protein
VSILTWRTISKDRSRQDGTADLDIPIEWDISAFLSSHVGLLSFSCLIGSIIKEDMHDARSCEHYPPNKISIFSQRLGISGRCSHADNVSELIEDENRETGDEK